MARFLRLGEKREKFILYAVTLSGALVLCTINFPYRPLSQIRSHSQSIAQMLNINENELPESATEVVAEEEPPETVNLEGETQPTTLDELLRACGAGADRVCDR